MIKNQLIIIILRLIGTIVIVGLIRYLFDFSVLSPDIIVGISALFGIIELYYTKIDESEKVFEEIKLKDYKKFIEISKVLKLRAKYFRFYWWLSFISSSIVFIFGLVLKNDSELIPDRNLTYFICFSILLFNIPVLITFIKAYFDSKDAIKEMKEQQKKDEMYLEN